MLTLINIFFIKKTKHKSYSWLFSYINHQRICDHRHYTLYLFIIIAYLLLDVTNATTNTTAAPQSIVGKVEDYVSNVLENYLRSSENSTASMNESLVQNTTSMLNRPLQMSDVRVIFSTILRLLAQVFLIVSYDKVFLR